MASLQSYIEGDNPADNETTMNGIDVSKDLEGVNLIKYFGRAIKKLEGLFRQCKELSSFLKKRVMIEKEHLRSLTKLSFSIAEERQLKFEGAVGDSWEELKEQLKYGTNHRQATITSLETQALQPLKRTILGELEAAFKKVTNEASQVIQGYNTQRMVLYKAKEKYKKHSSEWEASLLAIHHEHGGDWLPNARGKLLEKEEGLFSKMTGSREDYVLVMETTNWLQHAVFTNNMPELTKTLFTIAKDVIAILTGALQSFSYVEAILDGTTKQDSDVPQSVPQFDAESYCLKCIFGGVELEKVPQPVQFTFQEYFLQDEAAIIHIKKVQYQCRAKLNASDLVAQGAAFAHSVGSSYKMPNPHLVETCIEYLSQPRAFKEEGLFRVPGDSTVIRKYHSAYTMVADPNYAELQESIMKELDPNNITGLLKLHLRERPLFSQDTFTMIRGKHDGSDDKDKNLLPDVILESASKEELETLLKVVTLFCLVIEHSSENRMSSDVLALSCALSFFPQFKIAEANFVMLHFIDHIDTIKERLQEDTKTAKKPYDIAPGSPQQVNKVQN